MAKFISNDAGRIGSIASREFIANTEAISVGYDSFEKDLDLDSTPQLGSNDNRGR